MGVVTDFIILPRSSIVKDFLLLRRASQIQEEGPASNPAR